MDTPDLTYLEGMPSNTTSMMMIPMTCSTHVCMNACMHDCVNACMGRMNPKRTDGRTAAPKRKVEQKP